MIEPSLFVRADGGPGIGAGHLGRCLALVQAWVDWGGVATLASSSLPAHWADRFRREGVAIADAERPLDERADWGVLDGYRFGAAEEESVRKAARRLLVIDDHGTSGDHGADLVVDQNLGATSAPYTSDVLLGTRYALLRRDFRSRHGARAPVPAQARRLLVALGGSPPAGVVRLVEEALSDPSLRDMDVTWLEGVDDVAAAMGQAEIALSAAGSTCWELACVGLPAVLLPAAPNQEPLAVAMEQHGAAVCAGLPADLTDAGLAEIIAGLAGDPARRATMARRGPELVDGRGARRVVTRMRADLLDLRPAGEADARLLWEWANDPVVRASSFDPRPIDWESHQAWFRGRLAQPDVRMYIAAGPGGEPLGQVRFEGDGVAVIGLSVAKIFRGRGWGGALIDAATRRLFADTSVRTVVARIKDANAASRSAFEDGAYMQDRGAESAGETRHTRERSAG